MTQREGQNSSLLGLVKHLKLIEDLWQKLYYVKWTSKSVEMLVRLTKDMVRSTRDQGDETLIKLVEELDNHVRTCVATGSMLLKPKRQRLTVLIDTLRDTLMRLVGSVVKEEPLTRPLLASIPQVTFIGPEKPTSLVARLEDFGYQIHCITDLDEAEAHLREQRQHAVILDVDFPEKFVEAMSMIAILYAEEILQEPVLFLSERNDMAARFDAIQAGSAAYFSKPFDNDEVLATLREVLLPQTSQGYHRVLIVNSRSNDAREMAGVLEAAGVTPKVLVQPLQILQEIHHFRPDLLLIDLDIKETSGSDLARAVSQNRECETLPMILMCFPVDLPDYIKNLKVAGASLMTKPISLDYLAWEVKQRLHHARATRVKLNLLTDNDPVSGLYNRRWFLALLEREMEGLGLRTKSQAVLFVTIDNLREIRDSSGVAVADEMVGQAATRLRRLLNGDYPAARFSDTIFAILMPDRVDDDLLDMARLVREKLETGFYKVDAHALLLHISIGGAAVTAYGEDYLTLIQRAESACSLAREARNERIYLQKSIGEQADDQQVSSRIHMLKQVRQIIERGRLWLMFQPVVSMRGDTNERYEVLLRLRDDEGNTLEAGSVFGAVYDHELGLALDRWVINHALEMLRGRQLTTTLFIKVLPATLRDQSLRTWLSGKLNSSQVDAQQIVFSVAELSARQNMNDMLAFLRCVKMLGCGFCLDRFGRGEDSLHLLRNLGADYVKLDMHFVNRLAKDKGKQEQLASLVEMLDELGVATVVGGVEDVDTMPILWSLGIDLIQGFFLQQPDREMSYDFIGSSV
ncbi:MAG: hypothetical protein CSA09_02135 [Candidatus Contendobacter odensis]|uniref:GGDEF domain-containing response regulator n=1 Tax=Candidatus Contendibacter odensensis TaxID=1400860 RepID=A0A2G6PFF2_9GAMM|nr:MAG: hypothetical protein CSA09_02135 [Candidatus Contendobacter odensis]